MTKFYLDTISGNDAANGLTYETRVLTYTRIAELMQPGDSVELVTSEPPEENVGDELSVISEAYGPKKVQTPNMTVEQFSPLEIQRARDRESATYPTLGGMHITIASPDHCRYYPKRKSR